MFDIESLINEKLIEERENYENDFISMVDIMKSEELNYYIGPEYEKYFEETSESKESYCNDTMMDFDYSFELEDKLLQKRDEILIEEHEEYEINYFKDADFELIVDKIFDYQIESFELDSFLEKNVPDYALDPDEYEYDAYGEEMFHHCLYLEEDQFESLCCGCTNMDYMPNDDGLYDYLDCYDYPEGPNENLSGIKYY